jgi:hypothetical protein
LGRLAGGVCGVESVGSGWGPVEEGCCECDDETSGSGVTQLPFKADALHETNAGIITCLLHSCLQFNLKTLCSA